MMAVLIVMFFMACTRKVAPGSEATVTKQAETGKKDQAEAGQKTEETVYDPDSEKGKPPTSEQPALPPTFPPPEAPKGPGKPSDVEMGRSIYTVKCSNCHAAKNVKNYTFNKWESILKTMVPNAKLSSEEESYLVAYIRANAK